MCPFFAVFIYKLFNQRIVFHIRGIYGKVDG